MSDMGYDITKIAANDGMVHYSGLQQLNMEDSRLQNLRINWYRVGDIAKKSLPYVEKGAALALAFA